MGFDQNRKERLIRVVLDPDSSESDKTNPDRFKPVHPWLKKEKNREIDRNPNQAGKKNDKALTCVVVARPASLTSSVVRRASQPFNIALSS